MASTKKQKGGVFATASILVDGVHFDEGDEITGVDPAEIAKVVHMGRAVERAATAEAAE